MNLYDHVRNDMLDNIERRISPPWGTKMTAYQIDLDPVHAVIRLTVTAEIVTPELAEAHLQKAEADFVQWRPIRDHLRSDHGERYDDPG